MMSSIERLALRGNDKQKKKEYDMMLKFQTHLEEGKDIRNGIWDRYELDLLNTFLFLTAKPVIYLINLSQKDFVRKKNKWLSKIMTWIQEHETHPTIIPYSADFELNLALQPDDAAKEKFAAEVGAKRCVRMLRVPIVYAHCMLACCPRSSRLVTTLSASATSSRQARLDQPPD